MRSTFKGVLKIQDNTLQNKIAGQDIVALQSYLRRFLVDFYICRTSGNK